MLTESKVSPNSYFIKNLVRVNPDKLLGIVLKKVFEYEQKKNMKSFTDTY